jgi:hypothetical protein
VRSKNAVIYADNPNFLFDSTELLGGQKLSSQVNMKNTLLLSLTNDKNKAQEGKLMAKFLSFTPRYTRLEDVLNDHNLARLGDAYVNFIYSIALSKRKDEATGAKVSSSILAQALKKAELRDFLPKRMDRHTLGDAAEALIVYAWIHSAISIEESVTTLLFSKDAIEAFANLLHQAKERLSFQPTTFAPTL